MDFLLTYLETKASRCRELAAGERGDGAAALLKIAEELEAHMTTLRTRFLIAIQDTRERLSRGDASG